MGDKNATATVVKKIGRWVRSRSVRLKLTVGAVSALVLLVLLRVFVRDRTYFFMGAQLAQAAGISVLTYKLTVNKSCAGLSLKTQELTATYLTIRLLCNVTFRGDILSVFDLLSLVPTLWVIYMIRFKLKSTYMQDLDNMPLYYVLGPCAIVAIVGHPGFSFNLVFRFFYIYSLAIEAVAVLPQLRLIQKTKVVEQFTARYVFALGIARFLLCANWIMLLIDTRGALITQIGNGNLWFAVALLCEVVQTTILADFCYYYVKSVMDGQRMMRLPSMV